MHSETYFSVARDVGEGGGDGGHESGLAIFYLFFDVVAQSNARIHQKI